MNVREFSDVYFRRMENGLSSFGPSPLEFLGVASIPFNDETMLLHSQLVDLRFS